MGISVESKVEMKQRIKDLQNQVDELKDLVNTLLSVICEEPDGGIRVLLQLYQAGNDKILYVLTLNDNIWFHSNNGSC